MRSHDDRALHPRRQLTSRPDGYVGRTASRFLVAVLARYFAPQWVHSVKAQSSRRLPRTRIVC